jgi:hypothetical protein
MDTALENSLLGKHHCIEKLLKGLLRNMDGDSYGIDVALS